MDVGVGFGLEDVLVTPERVLVDAPREERVRGTEHHEVVRIASDYEDEQLHVLVICADWSWDG